MRILAWIALGFAAGCCANSYQVLFVDTYAPIPILFLLSILCFLSGKDRKPIIASAWTMLGCCAGLLWCMGYNCFYLGNAASLDGLTAHAEVYTTDYSFETGYGRGADGSMEQNGRNYSVRIYMNEGEELPPGTRLEGIFRFRLTTPGSIEGITSHSGKGIVLLAYQEDEIIIEDGMETCFPAKASLIRRQILEILRSTLPDDVYPFSAALLLGDTSELTYEMDTNLKLSGIRHVAAVSGLHVSILFALTLQIAFRKRLLSSLIGLPALFLFAAVAGFTPSVNRSCIMCALMLLSILLHKEYDGMTALAFAVLIMLIQNPLTVTSISFQLSCSSVAGIFLLSGPISGKLKSFRSERKEGTVHVRLKRWVTSSISTSLSAMVFTTPLCAIYFGTVSLIGVVTNLLTLWIISAIFYGLMAVCCLSLLHHGLAAILGRIIAIPVRFVLYTAKFLADLPFACVYTASPYVSAWLIFLYVILFLLLLSKKKKLRYVMGSTALGLCLALVFSWQEPLLYDTSITVVDVGQGQCILLQSEGKTYLVDCGGDQDTVTADAAAQLLLSQGIVSLDGIIVTHMDRDHICGLDNLLTRVNTSSLILPAEAGTNTPVYGGEIIYADRELQLAWGSTTMRIFGEKYQKSSNENGLCILLDTQKCDILITGDRNAAGETRLMQTMGTHDVDILIAGHHGSGNATSEALLQAVTPEIVCISVGEGNIYGHPSQETLSRLYRHGCRVYRTDIHGTVTIRR